MDGWIDYKSQVIHIISFAWKIQSQPLAFLSSVKPFLFFDRERDRDEVYCVQSFLCLCLWIFSSFSSQLFCHNDKSFLERKKGNFNPCFVIRVQGILSYSSFKTLSHLTFDSKLCKTISLSIPRWWCLFSSPLHFLPLVRLVMISELSWSVAAKRTTLRVFSFSNLSSSWSSRRIELPEADAFTSCWHRVRWHYELMRKRVTDKVSKESQVHCYHVFCVILVMESTEWNKVREKKRRKRTGKVDKKLTWNRRSWISIK